MRTKTMKARLVLAWRERCRNSGATDDAVIAGTKMIERWDSRELAGLIACFPTALPAYQGRRVIIGHDRYGREVVVPGDKIPARLRPPGIFPVHLLTGPQARYIFSLSATHANGTDATPEVMPEAAKFLRVECLMGSQAAYWPTMDSDMRFLSRQFRAVTIRVYREARDDPHDCRVDWYRNGQTQSWRPAETPERPPAPWPLAESA